MRTQSQQAGWELSIVSPGHVSSCVVLSTLTRLFCVFHIDSIPTVQTKPLQKWRHLHTEQIQIKIHLQVPWTFQREILRDWYVTAPQGRDEPPDSQGLASPCSQTIWCYSCSILWCSCHCSKSLTTPGALERASHLQLLLEKGLETVPILVFPKCALARSHWYMISEHTFPRDHMAQGEEMSGFPRTFKIWCSQDACPVACGSPGWADCFWWVAFEVNQARRWTDIGTLF